MTKKILEIELRLGLTFNMSIDDKDYILLISMMKHLDDTELNSLFNFIEDTDLDIKEYIGISNYLLFNHKN